MKQYEVFAAETAVLSVEVTGETSEDALNKAQDIFDNQIKRSNLIKVHDDRLIIERIFNDEEE
ncbi:hypothetical protein [Alteribacillus sp. YIM 98480]|uniref:hypothetical protein n=1 Tax=Alteribacillus sp. YIM 98480 TaxID=2606599 RepID=UPI00131ACA21|nr:hypothetical protein [Alteribacillus sp. YIM 98480]